MLSPKLRTASRWEMDFTDISRVYQSLVDIHVEWINANFKKVEFYMILQLTEIVNIKRSYIGRVWAYSSKSWAPSNAHALFIDKKKGTDLH